VGDARDTVDVWQVALDSCNGELLALKLSLIAAWISSLAHHLHNLALRHILHRHVVGAVDCKLLFKRLTCFELWSVSHVLALMSALCDISARCSYHFSCLLVAGPLLLGSRGYTH